MWRTDALQLLIAVMLDLSLGDPRGWPHVTRAAGGLTLFWEPLCSHIFGRTIFGGVILWLCVCATILSLYFLIRSALSILHPSLCWIWDAVIIYQTLAARDLDRHARNVSAPLQLGDLEGARKSVGMIVGRDTQHLDPVGISRATIEAVAESTTDGFVAPLFWAYVGGAPAALLYRTVNTLDSMVGHRTENYELMGKFSAIIDDVLGFIPARICALASLLPRGFRHVSEVIADAGKHASPNAGWSESAAAWALNVRLGGTNFYDGLPFHGPIFNPSAPEPYPSDIPRVLRWFWSVVLFCVLLSSTSLYLRDRNSEPQIQPLPPIPQTRERLPVDPPLTQPFIQKPAPPPTKIPGQIKQLNHGN
jgi:adenosylcobinamide-phosphate synthase